MHRTTHRTAAYQIVVGSQTALQTVVWSVLGTITKKSIGLIPIPPNTGFRQSAKLILKCTRLCMLIAMLYSHIISMAVNIVHTNNTHYNRMTMKSLATQIVRGLSHPKHRDCSNCSTSTIFGPELDTTISYQFLEGAKLGSLCVGHF